MKELDGATVEVVRSYLFSAAQEMRRTLIRTAFNAGAGRLCQVDAVGSALAVVPNCSREPVNYIEITKEAASRTSTAATRAQRDP